MGSPSSILITSVSLGENYLPPDSIHENVVKQEGRSQSSCYSQVSSLSNKDGKNFQKQHYEDDCLERCCNNNVFTTMK